MPALPKAECPTCGKTVAVRRNGVLREHQLPLSGQKCPAEQHTDLPLVTPPAGSLHRRARDHFWCPVCEAEPGAPCVKPNGYVAWPPHKGRLDAARDTPQAKGAATP